MYIFYVCNRFHTMIISYSYNKVNEIMKPISFL